MADPMAVPVTALVFSMAAGLVALFACFSTRRASITACRFAATLQENSWAKDYKQLNILGAAIAGYVFSDDSVTLNFKADPAGNSAAIQSMTELITFIHSIYAHNVGRHLCSSHFQRWEDYTATLKILQHLYKDDFYDLPPQNITVAIQPAPSRASVSSGASVAPALTHVSAVLSNDTQPMQKQRLARVVNCFECALRTSTSSHQVAVANVLTSTGLWHTDNQAIHKLISEAYNAFESSWSTSIYSCRIPYRCFRPCRSMRC